MNILRRLYHIARSSVSDAEEESPHFQDRRWSGHPDSAGGDAEGGQASRPEATRDPKDAALAESYANLEVPYGSDLETVSAAWRQLMKR